MVETDLKPGAHPGLSLSPRGASPVYLVLLNDVQVEQGEKAGTRRLFLCSFNLGAVATGEDPTSVAIASIQSAATFPDPNVKYVFRTENGGQVREGAR